MLQAWSFPSAAGCSGCSRSSFPCFSSFSSFPLSWTSCDRTVARRTHTTACIVSCDRPSAVKGGKGESLESWKQTVQEWKGRARRGAQARRAAPDPAEVDPRSRSADRPALRHHVKDKAGGPQARGEESPAVRNVIAGHSFGLRIGALPSCVRLRLLIAAVQHS